MVFERTTQMKRLDPLLRLVALVALAGCGTEDPPSPDAGGSGGTGGSGGSAGGSDGSVTGGSGGSVTGGSGGSGGSGGTGGATDGPPAMSEYFPFKVGNRWTYEIREPSVLPYRKEQVVVRMEAVGGTGPNASKQVFRVETRKYGAGASNMLEDATISWQLREGSKVLRYRETSCTRFSAVLMNDAITSCTVDVEDHWNPPRQRIDERPNGQAPANGVTWPEMYTEFKKTYDYTVNPPLVTPSMADNTDTWTVMETGVSAMVPAGTFTDCIVVQKRTSVAQNTKTYTFCRGVGKVKELGLGQEEHLATMPTIVK
jgi:hypothetical protein